MSHGGEPGRLRDDRGPHDEAREPGAPPTLGRLPPDLGRQVDTVDLATPNPRAHAACSAWEAEFGGHLVTYRKSAVGRSGPRHLCCQVLAKPLGPKALGHLLTLEQACSDLILVAYERPWRAL